MPLCGYWLERPSVAGGALGFNPIALGFTGSDGRTQIERNCTWLPWSWIVIGRASA